MSTLTLTKNGETVPALFENFFKPWNEWFDLETALANRMLTTPAVNITETSEMYALSLAVTGMKKMISRLQLMATCLPLVMKKK